MSHKEDKLSFFKFKQFDTFGAQAAEYDQKFLKECFVDSDTLEQLADATTLPSIVVGRTGSGKTALLNRLMDYAPIR